MAVRTAAATGLAESAVMFNTIVTNVPGAMDQLYLCGAAQIDAVSLGPLLPNVGLFHTLCSSVQNKKGTRYTVYYRLSRHDARPGFLY